VKLAVYHPWIYVQGGIERMLLELFRRSRHEWTLYTNRYDADETFPEFRSYPVVELTPRVPVKRSIGRLAEAAWKISRTVLPSADALLVSSDGFGDLILTRNRLPTACYCHTPLRILHDPVTRHALGELDRGKAAALSILGPPFKVVDRRLWRRYRHVFVSSAEVRSRAERARLAPRGPIEILPYGVDFDWFSDDDQPREDFFLFVGRIKWWKNIELAIAGLAEIKRRANPPPLVIAGTVDPFSRDYLESLQVKSAGLPVRFEVEPTQERIRELYRRCRALLFTSHNEDFGMVPLEAMGCGAPVIAVDEGGPRETILPGRTGWLVPPTPESFAEAMLDAMATDGKAKRMRSAARARAMEFSWERFVARVDDVMERIGSKTVIGDDRSP
jgi:glycosyltransferase involved in cell wall biosynthesis